MTDQRKSLSAKALNGGRWAAISAIVSLVLQFAQLAILGRLLGPSEFGLMAMMMVIIGLTNAIADFGLGNYLVQKETLSKRTFAQLIIGVSGIAIFFAIVIAISSKLVAGYYKQPSLAEMLPWLSFSIVVFPVSQVLMSALQRFFAFRQIAIGEIASSVLPLVVTTLMAMLGHGVWSLILGQIVAGITRALVFAIQLPPFIKALPRFDDIKIKNASGFAFYQTGERMLNHFGSNLDKAIVGRLVGDAGLGIYSFAYQLMAKPFSVLNPIFTRVALPLFVSIRDNNVRLANGYLKVVKMVSIILIPIYMVLAICSSAIINILMGAKWAETAPILYVLAFVGIFFSIGNPIGILILAKARPQLAFYFNLFSMCVYATACWIGGHYSALGVAVGIFFATACVVYPAEFYIRFKLVEMTAAQYFREMRHIFVAAALPVFLHAIMYLPTMEPITISYQIIIAGVALIFFFSYLFIYDRDLIDSLKKLLSNRIQTV